VRAAVAAAAVLVVAGILAPAAHADPLRCKSVPAHPMGTVVEYCDFGDHISKCIRGPIIISGNPCQDYPESDASQLAPGFWDQ
jgi:hypothetical protein